MTDNGDVGQFHHKFGLPNTTYDGPAGPFEIDPENFTFRLKFLAEELQEFFEGAGFSFKTPLYDLILGNCETNKELSHPQMFDALIDLVYVAHGTAHIAGYPWREGWIEVQAANMSKVRAERAEQSERGGTFDVIKPPNFRPPDIAGVLKKHGWVL